MIYSFRAVLLCQLCQLKQKEYYNTIKQKSGLYWLYSVGVVVYPRPPKGSGKFIPLPFGLPVAAANYAIAYKANKKNAARYTTIGFGK